MATGKRATEGDDVITHTSAEVLPGAYWQQLIFSRGGNDVLNISALPYGQKHLDELYAGTGKNYSIYKFQRHVYGGPGDDQLNMIFEPTTGDDSFRTGFHIYGDTGADTFNFQNVNNIGAGVTQVGRIEDFDVTRDKIQVDGQTIDLYDLPDNVRIVEHNGQYYDSTARPQQWILINNDVGGRIFYALEGVRYHFEGPGNDEMHFIRVMPDFDQLKDTVFENVHPYVAYKEYKDLDPLEVKEYYSRDHNSDGVTSTGHGKLNTTGTNNPDMVDVIHAHSGFDYVYAGAGDDLIAGGNNTDYLYGEDGNDRIWAGTEEDEVHGGNGDDYIEGNYGEDLLIGGSGDDVMLGGQDADVLYGDNNTGEKVQQTWNFDKGIRSSFFKDIGIGKQYTLNSPPTSRMLVVTDDDDILEDNNNNAPSGQTLDASSQVLRMDMYPHREGTYMYSRGYYEVTNTTTGEVGKLYQIRLDEDYDGVGMPGTDNEFYIFNKDISYQDGDSIEITSTLHYLGNVEYSEIATRVDDESEPAGDDTLYGDAGNDTLIGGGGDDTLYGGADDDIIVDFGGDDSDLKTDGKLFKVEQVISSRYVEKIGIWQTYTMGSDAWEEALLITDDDSLLEDNNNNTPSGQTLDASSQVLAQSHNGLQEGSYVHSRGYYKFKNLTTGETGKLYQIRVQEDYSGGMPNADREYYVFDENAKIHNDDEVRITSTLQTLGNVDYSEIGVELDLSNTASSNDMLYGGDGNDRIVAEGGNDALYGGDGDDYLSFDHGTATFSGGAGNDHFHIGADADVRIKDFNLFEDSLEIDGMEADFGDLIKHARADFFTSQTIIEVGDTTVTIDNLESEDWYQVDMEDEDDEDDSFAKDFFVI